MAEPEKPSGAVVKDDYVDKPSCAVPKSGYIDCIDKPFGAADVTRDAVLIPVRDGLWQIPDEEVQWVLSRRREDIPNDLFGPDCVESIKAVRDEFFEFQAWMRAEFDTNGGRVFVDDKFVMEREEHEQWMSQWDARNEHLDLGHLDLSDRLSDFYDEDNEDDKVEAQEFCTN